MVSLQENTQPPFSWNTRLSRLCMPMVRGVDLVHGRNLLACYGRSSVAMCRPQERERDRGACQTFSGDAGRSLSGMAGGAPPTSAGVATRVSQARRSISRSTLTSSCLWRSRQARAMSPSWKCSSLMRSQSPCPLIVRQVSSHAASSGCLLSASHSPHAPVREGQRQRLPTPASALSSPTAQSGMVFAPSASAETEKPRQDALGCGRGEATAPSSQRRIRMATPLRHTTSGTTEAPCPWRSVRVYCHWSTRTRRWRRTRSVRPIHLGPLAVGRGRSGCPS
jgi:hypothetical protein